MVLIPLIVSYCKLQANRFIHEDKGQAKIEAMIILLMVLFTAMIYFVMGAKILTVINSINITVT